MHDVLYQRCHKYRKLGQNIRNCVSILQYFFFGFLVFYLCFFFAVLNDNLAVLLDIKASSFAYRKISPDPLMT